MLPNGQFKLMLEWVLTCIDQEHQVAKQCDVVHMKLANPGVPSSWLDRVGDGETKIICWCDLNMAEEQDKVPAAILSLLGKGGAFPLPPSDNFLYLFIRPIGASAT